MRIRIAVYLLIIVRGRGSFKDDPPPKYRPYGLLCLILTMAKLW